MLDWRGDQNSARHIIQNISPRLSSDFGLSDSGLSDYVTEASPLMFTIQQIDDLHTQLGSAKTLAEYVRALKAIGVERYDSYLADGHSEYFGHDGHTVVSPPVHELLSIAEIGQRETFLEHLRQHEQRKTTYLEMSNGLAESGIEKWTVNTEKMTMTFSDKAGRAMLVEPIS